MRETSCSALPSCCQPLSSAKWVRSCTKPHEEGHNCPNPRREASQLKMATERRVGVEGGIRRGKGDRDCLKTDDFTPAENGGISLGHSCRAPGRPVNSSTKLVSVGEEEKHRYLLATIAASRLLTRSLHFCCSLYIFCIVLAELRKNPPSGTASREPRKSPKSERHASLRLRTNPFDVPCGTLGDALHMEPNLIHPMWAMVTTWKRTISVADEPPPRTRTTMRPPTAPLLETAPPPRSQCSAKEPNGG